jgi:tetratricopeptide (TPR) repeat protein
LNIILIISNTFNPLKFSMKLVVVFLFLASVVFAQDPAEKFYQKGVEFQKLNRHDKAIKEFKNAINKNENEPKYFDALGESSVYLHKSQEAYDAFTKAIYLNNKYAVSYLRRAELLAEARMTYDAQSDAEMAIKYSTHDTITYQAKRVLGTCKYQLGDFGEAERVFNSIIKSDSADFIILNNLSIVKSELKKDEEGLQCLRKIIELDPNNIPALSNLGFIYQQMEKYDKSIAYYLKLLEIDKNQFIAWNNMGYSKALKGDVEAGLKDINKSLTINPTNSYAYRNRALVYIKIKEKEKACEDLYQAKRLGFDKEFGPEVQDLIYKYCDN